MGNRPLIAATRDEGFYTLKVKSGSLPKDWFGHVYINSPAGTVNSGGLPYPESSPELGSPIMNGDGFVFRFDLSSEKVDVKTKLMRPPCYYADLATKVGNQNGYGKFYHFNNDGLTRMSLELGGRNELNTAVTPVKFNGDEHARILACYDAGRPWEIDPISLEMVTAIGTNQEYAYSTPKMLFPFPLIQSTAHPSFDPVTQELYLVNFTKSNKTLLSHELIFDIIKKDLGETESVLEKIIHEIGHHHSKDTAIQKLDEHIRKNKHRRSNKLLHWLKNLIQSILPKSIDKDSWKIEDNIFLMRWSGKEGPLDRWQVLDENGQPVAIQQCMHQTTLSKDYIILADASFKFSFDLLFNSPFKSDKINAWIRKYLTKPQEPNLDIYLVKREDLDPAKNTVTCKKLKSPIPLEAIHFSADYDNPEDIITMHLAHNSAACLAECVRTFDFLAPDGKQPVSPEVIGLISVGCMDIGRIGRVKINGKTGEIVAQDYIMEAGNLDDTDNVGVHTWGVGLYTYRDILSPEKAPEKIEHIFWSCYGLDPRLLTKFIYDLYDDYPNRKYTPEQMDNITKKGIPFVLARQNTVTMQLEDFFQFDKNTILKSIQFVPRKEGSEKVTEHPQMDGYLFTTELVNYPNAKGNNYQCEIWIFKAWDLKSGPCCVLSSDQLDYAFTLHSAWTSEAATLSNDTYRVDTKADYDEVLKNIEPIFRQKELQSLFDKHIYPFFKS